jgi:hypothetical protein
MTTLSEVYGECSILKRQAYWFGLREQSFAHVEAAAIRCLQTRKTRDGYPASWPTPADLVSLMYTNQEGVSDPPARMDRKALTAAPPDPEARAKIRALIRQVIEGLPDSPRRGEAGAPQRKTAATAAKSRREILREMFVLGANHVGECATLAVRAGYGTEEIAEAMRAVEPGKIEAVQEETEQPWLQEG